MSSSLADLLGLLLCFPTHDSEYVHYRHYCCTTWACQSQCICAVKLRHHAPQLLPCRIPCCGQSAALSFALTTCILDWSHSIPDDSMLRVTTWHHDWVLPGSCLCVTMLCARWASLSYSSCWAHSKAIQLRSQPSVPWCSVAALNRLRCIVCSATGPCTQTPHWLLICYIPQSSPGLLVLWGTCQSLLNHAVVIMLFRSCWLLRTWLYVKTHV